MKNIVDKDKALTDWKETARKFANDVQFYKDILVRIGMLIGDEAYISDDGSKQEDVLVTKLPHLVYDLINTKALDDAIIKENDRLREMLQNAVITEQNLTATINELSSKCREVEYAAHIAESKETNKHLSEIAEVLKTLAASK